MVQEVVKEILSAEEKAAKLLENATAKAEQIVLSAEIEAQNRLDAAHIQCKKYVKERTAESYRQAEAQAKDFVEQQRKISSSTVAVAKKNQDKAIDYIVKKVLL